MLYDESGLTGMAKQGPQIPSIRSLGGCGERRYCVGACRIRCAPVASENSQRLRRGVHDPGGARRSNDRHGTHHQPWRGLYPLLLIAQQFARRRYKRALR
jgi:hypothetical protein